MQVMRVMCKPGTALVQPQRTMASYALFMHLLCALNAKCAKYAFAKMRILRTPKIF